MSKTEDRFELEVRKKDDLRALCVELELDAAAEDVWHALTDAQELVNWFPFQARVSPGVGGEVWMSWDGAFEGSLWIERWEPGRHLRTTWSVPTPEPAAKGATDAEEMFTTHVDFHIEAQSGGRTLLRMVHSGFPSGESWDEIFDSHMHGWAYELRSLRHYLENHKGRRRRVIRARHPWTAGPIQEAWDLLWSPSGLVRGGAIDPTAKGSRFELTLPSGHQLAGRVLVTFPPTNLAAAVDGVEGAPRSLLRVSIECWEPPGPPEVQLWLATWGMPEAEADFLEASWQKLLEEILAQTPAA